MPLDSIEVIMELRAVDRVNDRIHCPLQVLELLEQRIDLEQRLEQRCDGQRVHRQTHGWVEPVG